jgi:hypothetical protein
VVVGYKFQYFLTQTNKIKGLRVIIMKLIKKLLKSVKQKKTTNEHRMRAPRIKLAPIEEVYFTVKLNGTEKRFRVSNLSTSGLCLITDIEFESGKIFSGHLHLKEKEIPVKIETIFVNDGICGAHFSEAPEEFKIEILNHFKMQYLGSLMNQVNPIYLQKSDDGEVRWFVDGAQNELHYIVDKTGIVNYHMSFLKNYLQGGRDLPVRTGHIEVTKSKDVMIKPSNTIIMDEKPNAKIIEGACTILTYLNQIPTNEVQELLKYLDNETSTKAS